MTDLTQTLRIGNGKNWHFVNGPGVELVVARLDGFIHVIDRQGKIQQTWATDGPVYDLCHWQSGDTRLALATEHEVRFIDRFGRVQATLPVSANKLQVVETHSGPLLIIATRDGRVMAISDNPS